MTRDLTTIRRDALRLVKKALRASDEDRTPILRQIAEAFVDAREHFTQADGEPDWKGRSYPYRVWIRDLVADAGVPKETQASLQSAIRYHVGSVLRERLDEDTRERYGLIPRSPKERSADRRQGRTALFQALTARDLTGGALVAISAATTALSKVEPKDLDETDGYAAEVADAQLADLERRVKALRKRLASRK